MQLTRESQRKALQLLMNMRGFRNRQSRAAMLQLAVITNIISHAEWQMGMSVVKKANELDLIIDGPGIAPQSPSTSTGASNE